MNPSLLKENNDKVVAARYLVRIACRSHRSERKYRRLVIKRQSLKAHMHGTKDIYVEFNVGYL